MIVANKSYYSIDEITDVVIKAIKEVKTDSKLLKDNEDVMYGIDFTEQEILAKLNEFDQGFFADKIRALPPVNPQPKTGHWIIIDDCEHFIAKCSECGRREDSRMISLYPYCHCGAKMVEPQERSEKE